MMSAKFKGQRQWVGETLTKFADLQKFQPKPFCSDPDWPDWVLNLWFMALFGVSHPGVKMNNLKKWKAKELGRFLGRHYAGEYLIQGGVPLSARVIQEAEKGTAAAEKLVKLKRPDMDLDKLQKQYDEEAKVWRPIFMKFMQETLCSACERPYVESSAFFEAFGKGIVMKPDDLLTERTMSLRDKICWMMFVMWRDIERLKSVADLHRLLERVLKPRGFVVKYKRIEKLCQRIKLKFKDPGRPPGSKIQTNLTSV
jgi:hypothetical protein